MASHQDDDSQLVASGIVFSTEVESRPSALFDGLKTKYDHPPISIHYPHLPVEEGLFYRNPRRLWPDVFVGGKGAEAPSTIPVPKGR